MSESEQNPFFKSYKIDERQRWLLKDFVSCLSEAIEEEKEGYADPFDQYALQLRQRAQSQDPWFADRWIAGYEAMVEEIAAQKRDSSASDDPTG